VKLTLFNFFKEGATFLWIFFISLVMIMPSYGQDQTANELYDPRGVRNPFIPLLTSSGHGVSGLLAVESIEDIVIEGIVYDPPNGSIIVVNGTVMSSGKTVGKVKVLEIEPKGALFSISDVEGFKAMHDNKRA